MNHTMADWKIDLIYSTISAIIYTFVYFILSLLKIKLGFWESTLYLVLFGFFVFVVFIALGHISELLLQKMGIPKIHAFCFSLSWSISIPVILFFSIALSS